MARSTLRQAPRLEQLESRQVLSAGGPTDQAQYMLEVLNLVRTNPSEGAKWVENHVDATVQGNLDHYHVNLKDVEDAIASARPRQPLAWDPRLAAAAQYHSEHMAANGYQGHDEPNASDQFGTVEQRINTFGYRDRVSDGENAFAYAKPGNDLAKAVDNAMQAFLTEWGRSDSPHRNNILQPDATGDSAFADAGIGLVKTANEVGDPPVGPWVVTQDFGREQGTKARILGVVFSDKDGNGQYSLHEGVGDARIEIRDLATGQVTSLQTWDAGGYQQAVDPGKYEVAAYLGGRSLGSQTVEVGTENVKIDFRADGVSGDAMPQAQENGDLGGVSGMNFAQVAFSPQVQSSDRSTKAPGDAGPTPLRADQAPTPADSGPQAVNPAATKSDSTPAPAVPTAPPVTQVANTPAAVPASDPTPAPAPKIEVPKDAPEGSKDDLSSLNVLASWKDTKITWVASWTAPN